MLARSAEVWHDTTSDLSCGAHSLWDGAEVRGARSRLRSGLGRLDGRWQGRAWLAIGAARGRCAGLAGVISRRAAQVAGSAQPVWSWRSPRTARRAQLRAPARATRSVVMRATPRVRALRPPQARRVKGRPCARRWAGPPGNAPARPGRAGRHGRVAGPPRAGGRRWCARAGTRCAQTAAGNCRTRAGTMPGRRLRAAEMMTAVCRVGQITVAASRSTVNRSLGNRLLALRAGGHLAVTVNPDTTILPRRPGPLSGAVNDRTAARIGGIVAELAALGLVALADKGYVGAGEPIRVPYKGGHDVPGMRGIYSHVSVPGGLSSPRHYRSRASLRHRARLAPHSIVPVLDALLTEATAAPSQTPLPNAPTILTTPRQGVIRGSVWACNHRFSWSGESDLNPCPLDAN